MSLRDKILGTVDTKTEKVFISEWGEEVTVKGLTSKERDEYEASLYIVEGKGKKTDVKMNRQNVRAKLVALSVVDDEGNRLFENADIEALGNKSASALDRIFEVAQRLSGLSDADIEDMEKN